MTFSSLKANSQIFIEHPTSSWYLDMAIKTDILIKTSNVIQKIHRRPISHSSIFFTVTSVTLKCSLHTSILENRLSKSELREINLASAKKYTIRINRIQRASKECTQILTVNQV